MSMGFSLYNSAVYATEDRSTGTTHGRLTNLTLMEALGVTDWSGEIILVIGRMQVGDYLCVRGIYVERTA